jgi:hypothetical protein
MSKRITTRRAVLAGAGGIAAGALAVLPAQARLLGADRVTLIQKLWAQRVASWPTASGWNERAIRHGSAARRRRLPCPTTARRDPGGP